MHHVSVDWILYPGCRDADSRYHVFRMPRTLRVGDYSELCTVINIVAEINIVTDMSILLHTVSRISWITWGAVAGLSFLMPAIVLARALASRLKWWRSIFSLGDQAEEFYVPGDRHMPGLDNGDHDEENS